MNDQIIVCPNCNHQIPLTEAISHKIKDSLEKQYEAQYRQREDGLIKVENELKERQKQLLAEKQELNEIIETRLHEKEQELELKIKNRVLQQNELEMNDLKSQFQETQERLKKSEAAELELRKERRQLEEAKSKLELEVERKIDEEREKIRKEAEAKVIEEQRLKELEKEKLISDLKSQIEAMKRRAEQVSQQVQGEVLELELEESLRNHFIDDIINPVPKGIRGADVIQCVRNKIGHECGTIIWEAKRTKNWNQGWIEKLKDDQREVHADMAVIISTVLPENVSGFGLIQGIWICDYKSAIPLAAVLRHSLTAIARTRTAMAGRNDKASQLYDYISGIEFRQKVEALVEAFATMKTDLEKEKRAFTKIWSQREKQIEKAVLNTVRLYGDISGLVGKNIQEIKALELHALTSGDNEKNDEIVCE